MDDLARLDPLARRVLGHASSLAAERGQQQIRGLHIFCAAAREDARLASGCIAAGMPLDSLMEELGPVKRRVLARRIALTAELRSTVMGSSGALYDVLEKLARSDTELMTVVQHHSHSISSADEFQAFLVSVAKQPPIESQVGATSHELPTGGLRFSQRR